MNFYLYRFSFLRLISREEVLKVQKYYITDGSNYIRQLKGKFITVNSYVMATEFSKREGEKILCCNLGKNYDAYYLEGIEDFKKRPEIKSQLIRLGKKN